MMDGVVGGQVIGDRRHRMVRNEWCVGNERCMRNQWRMMNDGWCGNVMRMG